MMQRISSPEPIIEPELPIVDAHHHLWLQSQAASHPTSNDDDEIAALKRNFSRHPRYLFDELLADVTSGHNVRATVYVEAHSMHRATGPAELKSIGEVEFANGMAAMSASGTFGDVRLCAAIVGSVDLRRGDAVRSVLEAHIRAGGERYRGIRASATAYDPNLGTLAKLFGSKPQLLLDATFRAGFRHLQPLGLSFDVFVFEPQLPELEDLAHAFPETQIVLNHVGMPIGLGCYAGKHQELFSPWRRNIRSLSRCFNVAIKLGGLGNAMCGFPSFAQPDVVTSEQLADQWRPYIETCIEAFGVDRCMFESNFPVDAVTADYPVIWNVFKRIVRAASADEKARLFAQTAARIYRIAMT